MRLLVIIATAVIAVPTLASAQDNGWLHLRSYSEMESRDGARSAELYVYDAEGAVVHSGEGAGQFAAGTYAEVPEGWYFVEVGRFRAPHNVRKLYVVAGEVTVVPSGWVSVRTDPLEEQPRLGCNQWNAELNAFAIDAEGHNHLVNTNRGSGVQTYGALQLPVGDHVVYFNELPVVVTVTEDTEVSIPTGYQDPVYGQRPQLATGPEGAANNIRVPLCEDGSLQVPAGGYHASSIVEIATYPYERRQWNQVTVAPFEARSDQRVRGARLEHDRYEGDGSAPDLLTEEERARLLVSDDDDGGSTGVQLPGFGR